MEKLATRRLSSWDEVRAHLASLYSITDGPGGQLHLTVGAARAPVQVRPVDVHGAPWLELLAVLGRGLRSIAPTPVLNRNFELAIGQLGMKDGSLMIRHLLPLGSRAEDLEEVVQAIAEVIVEGQGPA